MKIKRVFAIVLALIFLMGGLASCGGVSPEDFSDIADAIQDSVANIEQEQSQETGNDSENDNDEAEFTDEEGFVTVHTKTGEAGLHFNIGKWEEVWPDMSGFFESEEMARLQEEIFPITGLESKVTDVLVCQIPGMNSHEMIPINLPSVVLLLEDGRVAHTVADPINAIRGVDDYRAYRLLGLNDIVSLSYESSGEGIGDTTVFAYDGEGQRYDILVPWRLNFLQEYRWICNLEVDDAGNPEICGYLVFHPDNNVEWYVGWPDSDIAMSYFGTYKLILAEGQEYRPGTIVFDMELVFLIDEKANNEPLKGAYFTEATLIDEISLKLYPADGDHLYTDDIDVYDFYLGDESFG